MGNLDDAIESARQRQKWREDHLASVERERADEAAAIRQLQHEAVQRLKNLPGGSLLFVVERARWYRLEFVDDRFGELDDRWHVSREFRCWVLAQISNPTVAGDPESMVPTPVLLLESGAVVKLRPEHYVYTSLRGAYATQALPAASIDWTGHRQGSDAIEEAKRRLAELIVSHERDATGH